MKKNLLFLSLIVFLLPEAAAQNQESNLEKYWTYRNRLREKFIVISGNVEQYGVNIPASNRNNSTSIVEWGDANNGMSHYLSMLATELWLLKNNGHDYTETLKELYYAMLAMERLDLYSEYWWRYRENIGYYYGPYWIRGFTDASVDVNGMHLREDVTPGFWTNHQSHFQMNDFRSVFNRNGIYYMEEISQDNIYHHMEGLSLINALVGTESVADIPVSFVNSHIPNYLTSKGIKSGNTINFSLWAQDLVKRYIHWMQVSGLRWVIPGPLGTTLASLTDHWLLVNPVTGDKVKEGSGDDLDMGLFFNAGVLAAGTAMTGENLREQNAFINSNSESLDLFKTLFTLGPEKIHMVFSFPPPFPFEVDLFDIVVDDYKVRTLGTYSNILGSNTFSRLRTSRDNYMPFDYEHMPLMYCALYDANSNYLTPETEVYNTDRALIEDLLNTAPANGPTSYGHYNWSHDSRLVWPERLGQVTEDKEFSGLDYMVLHNLYYMAFRREDFRNVKIFNNSFHNAAYGNGTFRFGTLEASNHIPVSGSPTYLASQSITLEAGFLAPTGSNFLASVGSRPNQYQGILYKLPEGPSGGRINSKIPIASVRDLDLENVTTHTAKPIDLVISIEVAADKAVTKSLETKISTYPNPTRGTVLIELPVEPTELCGIQVLDVNGKILFTTCNLGTRQQIDLSGFPAGLYFIKIQYNGKLYVEKVTRIE